jgi:hypothetical protein
MSRRCGSNCSHKCMKRILTRMMIDSLPAVSVPYNTQHHLDQSGNCELATSSDAQIEVSFRGLTDCSLRACKPGLSLYGYRLALEC